MPTPDEQPTQPPAGPAAPLQGVFPEVPEDRPAVRITPDALRQVRGGHPWIYDSSITSLSRGAPAGALAVVFDDRRRFAAIGLYDPDSPIRIRVLHRGAPRAIDAGFWRERVDAALERRGPLVASTDTTGWRVIHGENDGLAGLVVDRYDATLVVKVYSAAWFPHLPLLLGELRSAMAEAGIDIDRIVTRLSRHVRAGDTGDVSDGGVVLGDAPTASVAFREHGLTFEADVVGGQKTGHFLDQRENRSLVGGMALDRRVLDVFACTGGFSVNAAVGGANEVVSVDISRSALAVAERNMERNRGQGRAAACVHRIEVGDAFEVMERLDQHEERFDLVIVDPPSFAHRRGDLLSALGAYRRLADLGMRLTATNGTYVQSSCSSLVDATALRDVVLEAATASGRRFQVRAETAHAVDHPIGFAQGAYLSTVFLRLEPRRR